MSPKPYHDFANLENARITSSEGRKRISLGTTNTTRYGAMGAFDKEEILQNRALAAS
jgi:hypothetical protein